MNRRLSGLSLSLIALALAGCSVLPESRKIEYKSAGKVPTLEVPPDLSQITRDDRYLVPDVGGKGSVDPAYRHTRRSRAPGDANYQDTGLLYGYGRQYWRWQRW